MHRTDLQTKGNGSYRDLENEKTPSLNSVVVAQTLTVDDVFSKIGFGRYQLKAYLIVGFTLMNDGAESLVLSILQNILKNEWQLTPNQIEMIGTGIFAGFFLGSLLSGRISDVYGRRKPLIHLTFLLYLIGLASAFAPNYFWLVFIRSLYGFLVGVQYPMCFTYMAEITPKESRGRWLVLGGLFFTFGELMTCLAAFFTLDGISSGNWHSLLVIVAQPCLLCWLGVIFFLYESPRYLIASKKDAREGAKILNEIAKQNRVEMVLGDSDVAALENWLKSNEVLNTKKNGRFRDLFKAESKFVTIFLWPVWFILSLTYYGMVYILPQILSTLYPDSGDSENLWSVTLPALAEIPSVLLGVMVIESGKFGRKTSMVIGFFITSASCFLSVFTPQFNLFVTVARGVLNGVFTIVTPYTTELYPTTVRATGLGMASAFSRIGGAVMPWMTQKLFGIGPKIPFLGFGACCILGALFCAMIPYDTTKRELDFNYSTVKSWASVLVKKKEENQSIKAKDISESLIKSTH